MKTNDQETITRFVQRARTRINRSHFLRCLCTAALLTALGTTGVAVAFILGGYKVNKAWFPLPLTIGAAWLLGGYLVRRKSYRQVAAQVDNRFDLKEGLISAVSFHQQGRSGGLYALQGRHTTGRIGTVDLKRLRFHPPWALLLTAAVLLGATGWLSTFADSPEVQTRKVEQALIVQRTEEIKDLLEDELNKLEKDLTEEEKQLLGKSDIPRMIRNLEITKDRTDALRQYAKIEKQLRKLNTKMRTKLDERFLHEAGKNLRKGKNTRVLGTKLKQRKYNEAAKEFDKLKPADNKDIRDARRGVDKLKEVSRRIRQTCDRTGSSGSRFERLSRNLDQSARNLDASLGDTEKQLQQRGSCDKSTLKKLLSQRQHARGSVKKMSQGLRGLAGRKKFLTKMDAMRKRLGQSQSYCASQRDKPNKGIGTSSEGRLSDKHREKDERGVFTQLKGIKGTGPTAITVQEAASGTGVPQLPAAEKRAQFRSEVEALVRREDIPETLRDGVKNYFEIIHELSEGRGPDRSNQR